MSKQQDHAEAVHTAFLSVLSRPPTPEEQSRAIDFLGEDEKAREQRWQELVWALAGSSEFRFHH